MFWLSHHHEEEYNRTYLLGGVRVCARCLGTYPVLLAVADWAVGRFRPASGSNAVRTLTGVLLGVALGRSLVIHLQRPLPAVLVWQAVLVAAVALPVLLATSRGPRND